MGRINSIYLGLNKIPGSKEYGGIILMSSWGCLVGASSCNYKNIQNCTLIAITRTNNQKEWVKLEMVSFGLHLTGSANANNGKYR